MGMTLGSIADAASPIAQAAAQPAPSGSIMGTPEPTGATYGKGGAAANNQPLTPGASPNPTMGFGKFGDIANQVSNTQPANMPQPQPQPMPAFGQGLIGSGPGNTPGLGFNYPTLPGYANDPSRTQNPLISKGVMPQRPMPVRTQPQMPGPGLTPPRGTPPQRVAPGRMPRQMPGRITF